jgi:hypothetical protein
MSQRQVLNTLKDAILDPTTGLEEQADQVALTENLNVDTDFRLERWMLSGNMKAAGVHNVAVYPTLWSADLMLPDDGHRDADDSFNVAFETFSADAGVIEDTVSVFATALIRVLDTLREFSDDHAGTVVQIAGRVNFAFGTFSSGNATSSGFICTFTVMERGTE